MSRAIITLDFRGHAIRREGDWLHATDMWRAAGAVDSKRPADWQALPQTREYLGALAAEESGSKPTRVIPGRGDRGGGTWLHRLAAVEYARYLDPAFAVFVNKVFLAATEPRADDDVKLAPPSSLDRFADALATMATNTMLLTTAVARLVQRVDALEGHAARSEIGAAGAKQIAAEVAKVVRVHVASAKEGDRAALARKFRAATYAKLRDQLDVGLRPRIALLPGNLLRPALNFLDGCLADARRASEAAESAKQADLPFSNVRPLRLAGDAE